jgi:hypothetical protein
MNDHNQRTRDLAAFANSGAQPNQPTPGGHALVRPTSGLSERVIGAQPVAVTRDTQKVLQQIAALAAAAGPDWFYRYPVRKAGGGQDFIEGPSIKLANDVARIFGNNVNEVRELDVGDAWVFYARFTDIETGFSMERAYRQRKSQGSMKTKDAERQLDIAYQIGQSKAIRNCIVNSLQIYADYAFEQARNSLIEKIGKDLDGWRKRTVEGLGKMPVELARVERVVGRAAKDWLAPNIAQIIAMMKSVADGMASVDEVFPPLERQSASASPTAGPAQTPEDGEQRAQADTGPADQQQKDGAGDPSAAGDGGPPEHLQVAYKQGQDARAAGHARKALPGEYRDKEHQAESDCWLAGFDGAPFPMLWIKG